MFTLEVSYVTNNMLSVTNQGTDISKDLLLSFYNNWDLAAESEIYQLSLRSELVVLERCTRTVSKDKTTHEIQGFHLHMCLCGRFWLGI